MRWKLFLDDERWPVNEDDWFIVRDFNGVCDLVAEMGFPSYVSFDHDLGSGPTGNDVAQWLIDYLLDHNLRFPKGFDYYVHSQNPIGAANIRSKMDSAISYIGYE